MEDREELRARAIELRLQGLSTTQIARELGIRRSSTLSGWLAGIPPPEWTRRPRAKDAERERAREMRRDGRSYAEIAAELGVSKSSISLWVRDLPAPDRLADRSAHAGRIGAAYWATERRRREIARQQTKLAAANQVGELTERELLLVGTALYWAEGAKDKPYCRRERIVLINSDPKIVQIFLAWLDLLEVPEELRSYRLSIHRSANLADAEQFWSDVVGVCSSRFARATLKRHVPLTNRLNVGADYHGCLVVSVSKSAVLYQRVEGWFSGLAAAMGRVIPGDRGVGV